MLKNKKKLLITIALLLTVTLAASVAAYTIAGVGKQGDSEKIETGVTQRSSKLDDLVYMSNIDLIIQDSYTDNYCFNIVHMIPYSMSKSDLNYSENAIDQYVSTGNFKNLVIDAYADPTAHEAGKETMKAGTVRVITLPVNSTVKQNALISELAGVSLPSGYANSVSSYDAATYSVASLLSDADLLYIESPAQNSYTDSSAMSDSLYSYIKDEYSGTNHKPIILDDITNSSSGGNTSESTYRTVINLIADRYLYSPVFSWSKTQTIEDFLEGKGSSHFFAKTLNGKSSGKILRLRKSGKTEVVTKADGSVDIEATRAKALEMDWITNRIINADKSALYYGNIENYPGYDTWQAKPTEGSGTTDTEWETYCTTATYYNGSLGKLKDAYATKESEAEFLKNPAYYSIEDIDLSNSTDAAALTADKLKSGYDFVIIEDSIISETISDDIKNAIVDLANGTQFIIFDAANVDPKDNGITGTMNLYSELYKNLVTSATNEPVNPERTLVVKNGFFATEALEAAGASKVSEILNGSNYRGSETNGRNGKKYRVLEIQPCYPIDTEVAESDSKGMDANFLNVFNGVKGNYYKKPASVLKKTPEQVVGDEEYYAFELSIARIAYATGLKYSQIELDQMSTEEFISTKEVVLDTYDLVYIGGDFSALVPHNLENVFSSKANGAYGSDAFNQLLAASEKIATNYDMYTHTGGLVTMQGAYNKTLYGTYYEGGTAVADVPDDIGYGVYRQGGTKVGTSTVYNGNDLTATKYQELQDYIDAGMPIIFGSDVTTAYEAIYDKSQLAKLSNHLIDPTSNMYALLDYAYKKYAPDKYGKIDESVKNNASVKSIYWGMDVSDGHVVNESNDEGIYGITAYITRYTDEINQKILSCIDASILRPTVQVRNAPKDYSLEDATTHYTAENGKMTISVSGLTNDNTYQNMVADLYVDKDGNGTFDADEKVDTKNITNKGSAVDLVYQFEQSDFYGLISWKVIASTIGTQQTVAPRDVRTGFAYYKRDENVEKKDVRVLQVMPVESYEAAKSGQNTYTLYLCPDCQWSGFRMNYNMDPGPSGEMNVNKTEATNGVAGDASNLPSSYYLGKHMHKFGINKYDSNGPKQGTHDVEGQGAENYSSNYAYDLAEDYNFSLDILYLNELNDISKIVKANGTEVVTKDENNQDVTTYVPVKMLDANSNLNKNGVERKNENGDITKAEATSDMTWVEYYKNLADKYYDLYEKAKEKAAKSDAKKNMDSILTEYKATVPETGKLERGGAYVSGPDAVQYWIDTESYGYYFIYIDHTKQESDYRTNYEVWVDLQDEVVDYYNLYRKYSRYACTEGDWIGNNYDLMVLGFANNFNDKDLTVDECGQIKTYVKDGGTVLLTHDSMTKFADPADGAFNLTTQLRTTFGQDRYHVSLDMTKNTTGDTTVTTDYVTKEVYITSPWNTDKYNVWPSQTSNVTYGPVTVTNKNTTIKLVRDNTGLTPTSTSTIKELYPVAEYSYDENSSVQNGTVTITLEMYDTQADLEAGIKSTTQTVVPTNLMIYENYNWKNMGTVGEGGFVDGSKSIAIDSGSVTITGKLKYPFLKFDSSTVGTRSKYYMTPISIKQREGEALQERIIWQSEMESIPNVNFGNKNYLSLVGLTDGASLFRTEDNGNSCPYKYAKYNWYHFAQSNPTIVGNDFDEIRGTDKVQRVNQGIVTTYPYGLGDSLTVSPTHVQAFAADLEDSNMTVWYTLAATDKEGNDSTSSAEKKSSLFAASPKDGMDSYFIYTYHSGEGTVHYCGAGHSRVTGPGKQNNDERKLYMNIAVDAVRKSASKPKITLYDKNHKKITENSKSDLKLDSDGNYIYTLDDINSIPEFDFDVRFNELSGLSDVYMFYDLNYDGNTQPYKTGTAGEETKYVADYSDRFTDDYNHVLIHHYTKDLSVHDEETLGTKSNPNGCSLLNDEDYLTTLKNSNPIVTDKYNLMSAKVKNLVPSTTDKYVYKVTGDETTTLRVPVPKDADDPQSKLALNAAVDTNDNNSPVDYFAPYNNYTYLVIYAKDGKGKTAHVRIKIMLAQHLFDLTDNTTMDLPQYYIVKSKSVLDVTDRTRFNI